MSASASSSEPGNLLSRVRMPILILLGFLLALGTYYFLYAQKKTTYLVGRDFRLLATTGGGVRASLVSYTEFLKSKVKGDVSGPKRKQDVDIPAGITYDCDPVATAKGTEARRGPRIWMGEPGNPIEMSIDQSVCATLDPGELFGRFFKPLSGSKGAFDQVLLVREGGKVFYQEGDSDLRITQLGPLLAKSEPTGSKPAGTAQPPTLSASASYHNVAIGGREFKLFVQPVDLPMESGDGPGTGQGTWLLCGLVGADKFVYKSLAIPSSFLLAILAALLLTALSWPLVRLRLMGERQRVRIVDVLLLGICSLLGVAILTLSVVDFYAYSELRRVSQGQLEELATTMAGNISKEIEAAHHQLIELEKPLHGAPSGPRRIASWNDFSLVDSDGMQKHKLSADGKKRPFIKVEDREYFQHALHNKTWTLAGSNREAIGPFYLESVTARTTLQQEAVLAEPVVPSLRSRYAVATLAIPMRSVIRPVSPPGFDFAVIDDDGAVLFHSDPSRNGVENFFTETDDDHRLRSAVFARHGGEPLGIRYFGKDYMAWLQPIAGLPWTVVALRSKESSRTLNMEWVVATVLFLLISACPFVVVLLTIAIARPGYRAPWMWPDPTRAAEYVNLAVLLAIYGLAFGLAIVHLSSPGRLLGLAWSLPFLALLTCYAWLQEKTREAGPRKIGMYVGYALLVLALLWALFAEPLNRSRDSLVVVAVAVLILSTCILSLLRPAWWARWTGRFQLPVVRAYPLAALLLLILTVVLPTLGIFKAVYRIELYSFIRHGQLKLARALAEQPQPDAAGPEALGFYGRPFFETIQIKNPKLTGRCLCSPSPEPLAKAGGEGADSPLPELLEDLLPHYSVHTAEMRELLHDRASDCSWDSHGVQEESMVLHSHGGPRYEDVYLSSRFSSLFTRTSEGVAMAGFFGQASNAAEALGSVLSVCLALLFVTLLSRLVLFICRRLFLMDLLEPLWSVAEGTLAPVAGRNLFVVRRDPLSEAEVGAASKLEYFDLRKGEPGGAAWEAHCRNLLDSPRDVLLAGFERGIADPEFNARKLALIKELLKSGERTVVVVSAASPRRLLDADWQAVLSSFTLIEEDLRLRPVRNGNDNSFWRDILKPFLRARPPVPAAAESSDIHSPVLRDEGGNIPFLQQIARGLDPLRDRMDREQLLEELGERAEGYYRTVWESCSLNEKVVLQHLAQEGLVNEKNRRVIRRLMARGLIRRGPSFCLLNESFRRFACSPPCRNEVADFEQRAAPSAWDRFQWPFLAVLATSITFFFATQQELLDSTLALVTGLTAGLPTVTKIMDLLGGRRSAAAK